mmetsp:Transcript_6509/g.11143  ORF Transcript_6509/g.11143 Transcript_6509/m.11143 type:complete len:122 (-) Transcript_6509:41-406(-)
MTRSENGGEDVDEEDLIPDNCFIRLVHIIAWLLTVILSVLSCVFIGYQLYVLYIPYSRAKIMGDASYRFPEYFYRVWGNDATDLTSEHWGYLGACAGVTFLSIRYVIPAHPFLSAEHRKVD